MWYLQGCNQFVQCFSQMKCGLTWYHKQHTGSVSELSVSVCIFTDDMKMVNLKPGSGQIILQDHIIK